VSTVPWPSDFSVTSFDAGIEFDVQISVMRNGQVDTYGLPGARWAVKIGFADELETMKRPRIEALMVDLEGGANRLSMHHLGRPFPNGALRGTPIVANTVAAGAKSMALANCNGGLKAGDLIGVLGQLFMVVEDASPSGGNMTVRTKPAVRNPLTAGTAVVWSKPPILWIPRSSTAGPFPFRPARVRPGFTVDLVEAY
jgi:hypothetical protein